MGQMQGTQDRNVNAWQAQIDDVQHARLGSAGEGGETVMLNAWGCSVNQQPKTFILQAEVDILKQQVTHLLSAEKLQWRRSVNEMVETNANVGSSQLPTSCDQCSDTVEPRRDKIKGE